jgi:hypothetical protein
MFWELQVQASVIVLNIVILGFNHKYTFVVLLTVDYNIFLF